MLQYYEPRLNLAAPEELNIMGIVVSLQEPVDGELLRGVVEELRLAGLPCELLSNEPLRMCTVQGMQKQIPPLCLTSSPPGLHKIKSKGN